MADGLEGIDDAALEALMAGAGEEEEEGGMAGLLAAIGLGGAGAYVGLDPYRRTAAGMLASGPPDMTRKELMGQLVGSVKDRFGPATAEFAKTGKRTSEARKMMFRRMSPMSPALGTIEPGKEIMLRGTTPGKSLATRGTATAGRLAPAARASATGMLSKMPWLKWALWPGTGWLLAAMLGAQGGGALWNQFVTKPKERREGNILGAAGIGERAEALREGVDQQALADHLEVLAESEGVQANPSNELAMILAGHDLSDLLAQRAQLPKPSLGQALDMVGVGG